MSQQEPQLQGVAGLKKHDIKVSGIVFMLYCLVAAGAFGIEEMIPEAGPGMTLLLLCVFPFIWAYPISSLVAECSSVMPSEGGVYVWVKEAFGEFWGFQTGWWATVSTYITNGVYVALVSGYVSQMIPMSYAGSLALKIGMIAIFTIVNLLIPVGRHRRIPQLERQSGGTVHAGRLHTDRRTGRRNLHLHLDVLRI